MSKTTQSSLKKIVLPLGILIFFHTPQIVQAQSINLIGSQPLISQADNSTVPDVIIDGGTQNPSPTNTTNNSDVRFTCDFLNGEYTVMYHPESQLGKMYPWAVPGRLGGGWTQEKRCDAISQRLEMYRPDGLLELRTGFENGYNILCVTTEADPNCRIVLTVPPDQDPELVRDKVFDNLLVADSGEQTMGVNTFMGDSQSSPGLNQIGQILNPGRPNSLPNRPNGINLRPFLDEADGGTGTRLNKSKSSSSRPANPQQLNPGLFR